MAKQKLNDEARKFFQKAGRLGNKRLRANHSTADFEKWGAAGAAKRWAGHRKLTAVEKVKKSIQVGQAQSDAPLEVTCPSCGHAFSISK